MPHVFQRPVVNYQKDYRIESKTRLIAAMRGAVKEASELKAAGKHLASCASSPAHASAVASPPAKRSPGASAVERTQPLDLLPGRCLGPGVGSLVRAASLVRIAVGKSTLSDAGAAVAAAWKHLISKLGGLPPHFCVVAYTVRALVSISRPLG